MTLYGTVRKIRNLSGTVKKCETVSGNINKYETSLAVLKDTKLCLV